MLFKYVVRINFKTLTVRVNNYCSFENGIRVRFAPSPTGLLHLGGLRTALYNYAFAKSQGGKFILRIEDTDQDRKVEGVLEKLLEDLEWAGIIPDEGPQVGGKFGPYIQSQRKELYIREVRKLLSNGNAYHCFCSKRRLDILRKNALSNRQVPKYDNHCRSLTEEEVDNKLKAGLSYCIRFKLKTSEPFVDLVYGKILHEVEEIEGDPVVLKTDGFPTYHLANVVDDHYMKISHVIRGLEWLQSTNKHIMMYRSLGYDPPLFAHLPLLLNSDGTKLSKRHGDVSAHSFREKGIYPRALINFLTKAGSGFSTSSEEMVFSLEELTKKFDISLINSNSCKLPMDRLPEFNRAEIVRQLNNPIESTSLAHEVKDLVKKYFHNRVNSENLELDDKHIEKVLKWCVPRVSSINDLVGENFLFVWQKPNIHVIRGQSHDLLEVLKDQLGEVKFEKEVVATFLKTFAKENSVPFKILMTLLRGSISGLQHGPGVAEMMEILGKETTIERIELAVKILCNEAREKN